MDEMKVRSLRASEETFEALKDIVESGNFANQGEALTALVKLWEMDKAKVVMPEESSIITQFNTLAQQMQDQFVALLESANNAREQARTEFAGELQSLQAKIARLDKELENSENLRKTAMSEERLATKAKVELEKQNEMLTKALDDKEAIISSLKAELSKMQSEQDDVSEAALEKEREARIALREKLNQRQEKYEALQEKYEVLWERLEASHK